MMRHCLALATAIALTGLGLTGLPALAFAQEEGQEEDCPPGGWFCEGSGNNPDATDPNSKGRPGGTSPTPPPAPPPEEAGPRDPGDSSPQPSVVVVTPQGTTPPKVVVVSPGESAQPAPRRRMYREWGVNMRLEGALLGNDGARSKDSGMGGLGFSVRYRPIPHFAVDAGVDFVSGKDWAGNPRRETLLMFNGIVFFNPHDAVQFYTFGGFGFSRASVDTTVAMDNAMTPGATYWETARKHYSYFGGQLGLGLEFRVSRRTALNADLLGFIRGRTDDAALSQPEFVDASDPARTTNTSGGGLLRGGITLYW